MKPAGFNYTKLISRFPLRKVASDEDLALADAMANELWRRDDLDDDENAYLEVLNILIRSYERVVHPFPSKPVSPREMLIFLLEENNMKQVDLCKLLQIPSGRASEIVSGTRDLSKLQIAIIADRFCLDAAFFLPKPKAAKPSPSGASNKWATGLKEKSLHVSENDSMIYGEKAQTTMRRKGTKPRKPTASAKKKATGA
jgi:antitoxin component HigA of HigAB toxin-antitoxin module